jgi:twinkle protein
LVGKERGGLLSCVEKIKHNVSHCSSEKGLQVFFDDAKGKYSGYCFSCASRGLEAYVEKPYEEGVERDPPKVKSREEIQSEIEEIKKLRYPEFKYREIPAESFKKAGVRMAFSEFDGVTPNSFNFPFTESGKLVGYKTIVLDKKIMWSVGSIKSADLFNWEIAKKKGTKRLYITEGEWDCLALEYMLDKNSGGKYKYAVTSLPHGAGSAASVIGRMRKEIESLFEEVVLVFDNDESGWQAVKDTQKVLPSVLEAPHIAGIKDANEALQKGQQNTFVDFVMWKARKPPIQGVVTVSEAMERGTKEPEKGLSYPWPTVSEIMYGQRYGEATCVAGGVGVGKTVIAHESAAWNAVHHKVPCFVALLEEQNIKTCWNIAAKVDSLPYNKPEVFAEHKEQYYETMKFLEDKIFMWNSEGNSEYRFDLSEIINAIRFNHAEYGCKFAYIDNMTRLADRMSSTEANEFINRYSSEIANLASELGIHITLFSHLNPPKGREAKSHEEGGEVLPVQLTGSRGVMRSFPNLIGFERNTMAGENQNNSFISVIKNRDYGDKRKVKTQYSSMTGRLLEFNWEGDNL